MKNGLENIDEVFKQAFDGFEANVDPSVWTNIQSSIATGTTPPTDLVSTTVATTATKAVALKIAAAVIAVSTIATATYFVVTSNQTKEVVAEKITEQPTVELIEETLPIINEVEEASTNITKEKILVVNQVVEDKNNLKEDKKALPFEEPAIGNISDVGTNKNNEKTTTKENDNPVVDDKEPPTKVEKTEPPKETKKTVEQTATPPQPEPKKNVVIANTISNIFTPNGDGINDVFKITGENIDKMEILVMDKTGKDLFWLRSVEDEWQGKDMGGYDLPSGLYFIAGSVKDKEGNTQVIKQVIQLNR